MKFLFPSNRPARIVFTRADLNPQMFGHLDLDDQDACALLLEHAYNEHQLSGRGAAILLRAVIHLMAGGKNL